MKKGRIIFIIKQLPVFLIFVLLSVNLIWIFDINMKMQKEKKQLLEIIESEKDTFATMKEELPDKRNIEENYSNKAVQIYEKTIDFMTRETRSHREFIEQQRQELIRLLAFILTTGFAFLGFIGISKKNDIDRYIKESHTAVMNKNIEKFIGGENNKKYLATHIEVQPPIKKTKVLFIVQKKHKESKVLAEKNSYECMQEAIKYFKSICEVEEMEIIGDELLNCKMVETLTKRINKQNIVVYESCKKEAQNHEFLSSYIGNMDILNRTKRNKTEAKKEREHLKREKVKKEEEIKKLVNVVLDDICNHEKKFLIVYAGQGNIHELKQYSAQAKTYITLVEHVKGLL